MILKTKWTPWSEWDYTKLTRERKRFLRAGTHNIATNTEMEVWGDHMFKPPGKLSGKLFGLEIGRENGYKLYPSNRLPLKRLKELV